MTAARVEIPSLQPKQERIIIVGAGIVGSALAYYLSIRLPAKQVVLLDPSPSSIKGSTAIAPGLVGQLNTIPHLTVVAKETVAAYSKFPGGFQKVGGLEIANTKEGLANLENRKKLAISHGLEVDMLNTDELAKIAPDFHANNHSSMGLFFASDGTANPKVIVEWYQEQACARGVIVVPTKVTAIHTGHEERLFVVTTDQEVFETGGVIVAAGIWTPILLKSLGLEIPLIPVAHPYAHGPSRAKREKQQPFVRWPEQHVYARDHGERDGFGSYAHRPIICNPGTSAIFESALDSNILESALAVFPPALKLTKSPYETFNGIFALTPDSMPFAGAVPHITGLYVAAAVWITHAAGVSRLVADMIAGTDLTQEDEVLKSAFDPTRFQGGDTEVLQKKALGTYNDIYNQVNR